MGRFHLLLILGLTIIQVTSLCQPSTQHSGAYNAISQVWQLPCAASTGAAETRCCRVDEVLIKYGRGSAELSSYITYFRLVQSTGKLFYEQLISDYQSGRSTMSQELYERKLGFDSAIQAFNQRLAQLGIYQGMREGPGFPPISNCAIAELFNYSPYLEKGEKGEITACLRTHAETLANANKGI